MTISISKKDLIEKQNIIHARQKDWKRVASEIS
jgi:hypothetical protein